MLTTERHPMAEKGIRRQGKQDHEEEMISQKIPSGETRGGRGEGKGKRENLPPSSSSASALSLSLMSGFWKVSYSGGSRPLAQVICLYMGLAMAVNCHFDSRIGTQALDASY